MHTQIGEFFFSHAPATAVVKYYVLQGSIRTKTTPQYILRNMFHRIFLFASLFINNNDIQL